MISQYYCQSETYKFGQKTDKEYLTYTNPITGHEIGSLYQWANRLESWNNQQPVSTQRPLAWYYTIRFTEIQAKQMIYNSVLNGMSEKRKLFHLLSLEHQQTILSIFEKTLTLCQSAEELYTLINSGKKLKGYNPARSSSTMTIREFCRLNGFVAAQGLTVCQDGELVTVENGTDDLARLERIHSHSDRSKLLDEWRYGPIGYTANKETILIKADAVLVEE